MIPKAASQERSGAPDATARSKVSIPAEIKIANLELQIRAHDL